MEDKKKEEKYSIKLTHRNGQEVYLTRYVAYFILDENDYGNGYYLYLKSDKTSFYLDIRYDKTFRRDRMISYLENWVKEYYDPGNEGKIVSLQISC